MAILVAVHALSRSELMLRRQSFFIDVTAAASAEPSKPAYECLGRSYACRGMNEVGTCLFCMHMVVSVVIPSMGAAGQRKVIMISYVYVVCLVASSSDMSQPECNCLHLSKYADLNVIKSTWVHKALAHELRSCVLARGFTTCQTLNTINYRPINSINSTGDLAIA